MSFFLTPLQIIALAMCLSAIGLSFRNNRVFGYREEIRYLMFRAAREDIEAGRDWRWRYRTFSEVSYEEMLYKFWKPLDSFYEDMSFVDSDAEDKNANKPKGVM